MNDDAFLVGGNHGNIKRKAKGTVSKRIDDEAQFACELVRVACCRDDPCAHCLCCEGLPCLRGRGRAVTLSLT